MSTFVLIIILNGTGKAALSVPFNDVKECQRAAVWAMSENLMGAVVKAACFRTTGG